MAKLFCWLFTLYLMAAAGFGGWRGPDLWSGWGVWCFVLPPLVWWGFYALDWRRRGGPVEVLAVMGLVAFMLISAAGLGIAWVIAELTEKSRLFQHLAPAVRALIGAALGAAVGGLTLLHARSQKAAEPRQRSVSESMGGLAESDAAADGGRDAGS